MFEATKRFQIASLNILAVSLRILIMIITILRNGVFERHSYTELHQTTVRRTDCRQILHYDMRQQPVGRPLDHIDIVYHLQGTSNQCISSSDPHGRARATNRP